MPYLGLLAMVLVWAFWMTRGRGRPLGNGLALALSAFALFAAYDGTWLALDEYARARHGRVVSGIVLAKFSRAEGMPRAITRRSGRRFTKPDGFRLHDGVERLVLTGSLLEWIVDYRYPCDRPDGCRGRDFVPESLWRRLSVGQPVNVRTSRDDARAARLDDHPRWAEVLVDLAFAGVLLIAAAGTSSRLRWPRLPRPGYLTAPAVVTAVEEVTHRDATQWRVRFAYFDPAGVAQESATEVSSSGWKPGDACVAVFSPQQPELAWVRRADA